MSFSSKQLQALWQGRPAKIDGRLHKRILLRLYALDATTRVDDLNVPGFDFHPLTGFRPPRFTVHVNGPWCLTFGFEDGHATMIDFENYH